MATLLEKKEQEQELMRVLSQGDHAAFEQILLLYERPIWNHLRRITGSVEDAFDLTQETFIKVYKKQNSVDPTQSFKNWVYRIATNTAYDFLRAKKRMAEVRITDNEHENETIPDELTYSTKELDILSHDLEAALLRITPHYKNVLLLYYREGFGYEELAAILDLPLNTIKTHVRRAKQSLREHIKNYG